MAQAVSWNFTVGKQTGTIGQVLNGKAGVVTIGTKTQREFSKAKDFEQQPPNLSTLIYIVGTGA